MSADLTFNRISYSPVNNVLEFGIDNSGQKVSIENILIKVMVKMDPNEPNPVGGALKCELRHPNIFKFENGENELVKNFNNKTTDFTEEFVTKIKFNNPSDAPEINVVLDVSVKDDKFGDRYPENSDKGKYWWKPVISIKNIQKFI
ncbi:hypothetical protein [Confluentibacter sediminis]|uniref:hypothetical protein n=1 Tax=Confluentibacter sediminis TaxID=2219045 RepID=UPI000DABF013|nr:hypothetical protein [Confluentibacter sediminis]